MGNRAVITTEDKELGIYLHWHGDIDCIQAFCNVCKDLGFRSPETDAYGFARLCQVIGNFFGGDLSLGIDKFENTDYNNWDNGYYIIKDWVIIKHISNDNDKPIIINDEYMLSVYTMCMDRMKPLGYLIKRES